MAKTSHGPSAHYHHSKLLGTSGALYSYEALLKGRVWSLKSYGLDAIKTGYSPGLSHPDASLVKIQAMSHKFYGRPKPTGTLQSRRNQCGATSNLRAC